MPLHADGSEDLLPPGHEEVADEELDKEEVARLKREKRERMRREALAAGAEDGGAGAEGSGDEEGEDFIPLDGGQRLSKGERRLERVGVFFLIWGGVYLYCEGGGLDD